jgi:hypothetical protein
MSKRPPANTTGKLALAGKRKQESQIFGRESGSAIAGTCYLW